MVKYAEFMRGASVIFGLLLVEDWRVVVEVIELLDVNIEGEGLVMIVEVVGVMYSSIRVGMNIPKFSP